MKSLLLCFPRKKIKTNKLKNQVQSENQIVNHKPAEINNSNAESVIEDKALLLNTQQNHVEELDKTFNSIDEEIKKSEVKEKENREKEIMLLKLNDLLLRLENVFSLFLGDSEHLDDIGIESNKILQKLKEAENIEEQLINRFNNALLRIENVINLLSNKFSGYCLSDIISLFYNIYDKDFRVFQIECENMNSPLFIEQSNAVSNLFTHHNNILSMIKNGKFNDLNLTITNFQNCVVKINEICLQDDDKKDLYRLIADSIVIFGWICVFERPRLFVQNNLDGILINITRLLNESRFLTYTNWLKSWAVVLKKFSSIVTKNFHASLIWGINGPVPIDILKCMIECNYSAIENNSFQRQSKGVIIKTTTADKISCETMTDLMKDLRSGRQKMRLKSVKKETMNNNENEVLENDLPTKQMISEINNVRETSNIISYNANNNMWSIDNAKDESDIEVLCKSKDDSISIINCCNCSIQISGIIKLVKLEHCSSVNLVIDEITNHFLVIDSSNIETQVFSNISKVNLKSVAKCRLFIPLISIKTVEIETLICKDVEIYVCKSEGSGLELDDYNKYAVEPNGQTKFFNNKITTTSF